jgi:hypothetical protein
MLGIMYVRFVTFLPCNVFRIYSQSRMCSSMLGFGCRGKRFRNQKSLYADNYTVYLLRSIMFGRPVYVIIQSRNYRIVTGVVSLYRGHSQDITYGEHEIKDLRLHPTKG